MKEADIKKQLITQARLSIEEYKNFDFSLNEILQKTKVSKGSFYYHFENKEDLICHAVIPLMRRFSTILMKRILECKTLRERIYIIFEPLVSEDMEVECQNIEYMYKYLFFGEGMKKSKSLHKLHVESRKNHRSMFLQAIKCSNIKITKEIRSIGYYMLDTMIFYSLINRSITGKTPRQEIIYFIDTICSIIESKSKHTRG